MTDSSLDNTTINRREISVKDLYGKARHTALYVKQKWKILIAITILGALAGLAMSFLIKPKYTASCTFVLEEGTKEGLLSQYSGLASLAGIDLGNSASGIFKGDNILELYKSRSMIEKTLLSTGMFDGKNELLINRYIDYNKLRDKWKNESDALYTIRFADSSVNLNRLQDSIVTDFVETFNKELLGVSKPDKKLSIIKVEVTTKDELFAKQFTDKMVENVNDFYIATKTKKSAQNVVILQHQADSVKRALNAALNGVASAIDADPNANPLFSTLKVPSQQRQVDVQANTAIYSEMVKNLEISKIALRQETPLIQIIDKPVLPLQVSRVTKAKGVLLGAVLACLLAVAFLVLGKFFKSVSASLK